MGKGLDSNPKQPSVALGREDWSQGSLSWKVQMELAHIKSFQQIYIGNPLCIVNHTKTCLTLHIVMKASKISQLKLFQICPFFPLSLPIYFFSPNNFIWITAIISDYPLVIQVSCDSELPTDYGHNGFCCFNSIT